MGEVIGNLTTYVKMFHGNSVNKGFYDKPFSKSKMLLLLNCEISEAVEADRKGLHATPLAIEMAFVNMKHADAYGEKKLWAESFAEFLKDTFEMELTDLFIRALDLYGYFQEVDDDVAPLQEVMDEVWYGMRSLVWDDGFGGKLYDAAEDLLLDIQGIVAKARHSEDDVVGHLIDVIYLVMYLAKYEYDFDLFKCAELKHAYNQTRERMHGKRY